MSQDMEKLIEKVATNEKQIAQKTNVHRNATTRYTGQSRQFAETCFQEIEVKLQAVRSPKLPKVTTVTLRVQSQTLVYHRTHLIVRN